MVEEAEAEAVATFPELELIDSLISGLEALIHESDETPLTIDVKDKPRRLVYRIIGTNTPAERKLHAGDAIFLNSDRLILRCASTEAVRMSSLEVTIQAEKSGRGETIATIRGKVKEMKRVRGGYDLEVEVSDSRKTRITPSQKLRECLGKGDSVAWNRWCQDITGHMELVGMDLRNADLTGYDLCCADLTGSDLSGANLTNAVLAGADLSHTIMDNVTVTGTDFFRARMSRSQAALLPLSGMPEVESVMFDS